MTDRTREAGAASAGLLLLILVAAIGGGAWNYHRNLERERADRAARPLAGYDTADLEALADAYRTQVASKTARFDRTRSERATADDRAYFDEQVGEFEKVQRKSAKARDVGADLAGDEASLAQIEAELATRGGDASEWEIHWRRLTSF
jgi:hypothetical protein